MKYIEEQFDKVAIEYDYVTSLREGVDKCLIEHFPESKVRALDIGCGGGNNCVFLSGYFQSVFGIDISDSFLKIAQRKADEKRISNIQFLNCDAETMDFTDSFDLIYSRTTFHHLNVPHVLEKCKNMLSPGGVLYIMDNVSKKPTPPTWSYITGAILEYPGNHRRYGSQDAKRIFRHSVSADWLAHLASDRYLSEADYHRVYGSILPGCELIHGGWNMKVIWKNDNSY